MDFIKNNCMMENILDNIPQYIFWKDVNLKFIGCNNNFAKSVGLSINEIAGKTDYDIANKEDAELFIKTDKQVIETNTPIYGLIEKHHTLDGEVMWININKVPLKNEKNEIVGILGTFENITDRIKLEEKIQKDKEKYKNLIEFTNTGYIILDKKINIIEVNKVFCKIVKMEENDLINKSLRTWISTENVLKFDDSFKSLVTKKNTIDGLEITLENNDGKSVYLTLNANILENGETKILCLVRDISQKKLIEDTRYIERQKQKDRLKQNVIALRNSLQKMEFNYK